MSGSPAGKFFPSAVLSAGTVLGIFLGLAAGAARAAVNADTGLPADRLAPIVAAGPRDWWDGGWARLRDMSGLPAPTAAEDPRFQGLAELRRLGVRSLIFFAPPADVWLHGRRVTGGQQSYPLDLGEAYAYAERLATDAWPNVAAWEIGNEPDLFWTHDNAATYAAYLKAVALGLRAGTRAAAEAATRRTPRGRTLTPPEPLVLNGALAMTPGPFLEQLASNDAFSYLDGFNWHFYGYAEDFTAQYRQFEDAVVGLTAARARETVPPGRRAETKSFPVFLTEYGYAGLDANAAASVGGRVRQWRWFQGVNEQMQTLRVAGPLAFYLPPYFEAGHYEFGLAMRPGGPTFSPADFGLTRLEPWMRNIGLPIGANVASPALAWLAARPAPGRSRDWRVTVAPPSPVVIDFVPDDELDPLKDWHGYLLKPGAGRERTGGGELRIYNFSPQTLTGRLTASASAGLETTLFAPAGELTLAPFGLLSVPVRFRLTADALRAYAWQIGFAESTGRVPPAAFATKFFPNATPMSAETLFRFDHPAEAAANNRRLLLKRPLAGEEPRLHAQGRWLVSDDVSVEETAEGWQFHLAAPPAPTLRCAMAELPLPDGFEFPDTQLLTFEHRLVAAPAGVGTAEFDCLIRAVSGNLFEVLPRTAAGAGWQRYLEAKENFTGMSYGRMSLPWRFGENRAAALVFFFRPQTLPATFELRGVGLARYRVP